jgi:hypothetical protein
MRHELKKEDCWGVDCAAPFHVGLQHSLSQQDKLIRPNLMLNPRPGKCFEKGCVTAVGGAEDFF